MRKKSVMFIIMALIMLQFADSVAGEPEVPQLPDLSGLPYVSSFRLPENEIPWWERTALDLDRNGIHDSLDRKINIGEDETVDVYLD
ncbi:MAG: hypothetical protein V3U20_00525, partial [Thermoplasmata archaeon]